MLSKILLLGATSAPIFILYFIKKTYNKQLKQLDEERCYYHQLIAVDIKNFNCRQHFIDQVECNDWCSLSYQKTLQNFISSARFSICLCMYTFTMKRINYELIKAHERGVHVRVIIDKKMFETKPMQEHTSRLKSAGIVYKMQPNELSLMHHKFCLIDKESTESARMFFGSLNLTSQGLTSNFDNIILTNNLNLITRFSEEFEELWNIFS